MGQIGLWMLIFGVGSFLLNMVGMEFKLLMWIDLWGPSVGTMIRIGLAVVGGALLFLGRSGSAASASADEK